MGLSRSRLSITRMGHSHQSSNNRFQQTRSCLRLWWALLEGANADHYNQPIARPHDEIAISSNYEWVGGRAFFDTTKRQLRALQHQSKPAFHFNLAKWQPLSNWRIKLKKLMKTIWLPYLKVKLCFLAWQVLNCAPTTNSQRWPLLASTDTKKQCKQCNLNCIESTVHCFWECQEVA